MKDFRFQMSVCRFVLAVILVTGASMVTFAQAQGQPPVATPQVSPAAPAATDEFRPMSELAPREVLPATPLVFYAYAFVWLALIGYVFFLWRRMAGIERDLATVQRRLQDGAGGR